MKALLSILLALSIGFVGCASSRIVNGQKVSPYGIFSQDKKKEDVTYKVSGWSLLWGTMGIPAGLLGPIYFYGFKLYEPVGEKTETPKTDEKK